MISTISLAEAELQVSRPHRLTFKRKLNSIAHRDSSFSKALVQSEESFMARWTHADHVLGILHNFPILTAMTKRFLGNYC